MFGRNVTVHDEVALSQEELRPDFAVDTAGGRTGYIELKALDKGVPGHPSWRPTAHDRQQGAVRCTAESDLHQRQILVTHS